MDLRAEFPSVLRLAVDWAVARSREVQIHGIPLSRGDVELAQSVGVARPELVRVASVSKLPVPVDPTLRTAALQTGLLGPGTAGLTLGYAILLLRGHESRRLLSHELRHVQQYESAGSIAAYLPLYLWQIVEYGYVDAPFERDAREHEVPA